MRHLLVILLTGFFLLGCSHVTPPKKVKQEWIYFQSEQLHPVQKVREIVVADVQSPDWVSQVYIEHLIRESLVRKGFRVIPGVALFPPVREYAEAEILASLRRHQLPLVLMVRTTRVQHQPVKSRGMFETSFSPVSGKVPWGRKRPVPYATHLQLSLVDPQNQRVLWIGEVNTPNPLFIPVISEMGEKVAASLKQLSPTTPSTLPPRQKQKLAQK